MNRKKILALFLSLSLSLSIGAGAVPKVVFAEEAIEQTATDSSSEDTGEEGEVAGEKRDGDEAGETSPDKEGESGEDSSDKKEGEDSSGSEDTAGSSEGTGEEGESGEDKDSADSKESGEASEDSSTGDSEDAKTGEEADALSENKTGTESDDATADTLDLNGDDGAEPEQSEITIGEIIPDSSSNGWKVKDAQAGGIGTIYYDTGVKARFKANITGYNYKAGDIVTIRMSSNMKAPDMSVLLCHSNSTGDYITLGTLDAEEEIKFKIPKTDIFTEENPVNYFRFQFDKGVEGDFIQFLGITITSPDNPDGPSYVDEQCPKGVAVSYYTDIYSRGFAWSTNDEVSDNSLFYVKASEGQKKDDVDWDSEEVVEVKATMKESTDVSDVTWHLFKAHVEDLEHGAKYFFRTGNNETGFSDVGSFTVEADSDQINSLRFVHLTDCQEDKEVNYHKWANVLKNAMKVQPESKFVAFTGDLTNDSHQTLNMEQWIWGLDAPKDSLLNTVIEPSSGNHDKYPYSFTDRFDINWADYDDGGTSDQLTGGCYSYTYGDDIVFINLNTNEADGGMDAFQAQYDWFVSELEAHKNYKWKIVQVHKGLMSTGNHTNDGEVDQLRDWLPPLFAKYKVDLVLQGHDHVYTRSRSYYYGNDFDGNVYDGHEPCWLDGEWIEDYEVGDETRAVNLEPCGTHYVTINFCASKQYAVEKNLDPVIYIGKNPIEGNGCSIQNGMPMFGAVTIEGDVLVYDAYVYDANTKESTLYDTFAVDKNNTRGYRDRNEGKKEVTLSGITVESKKYDGVAPKLDISRFVCSDPTVIDCRSFSYVIEGRDGTTYSSTEYMPKEVGKYTITISVGKKDKDHFGSQVIDFEITP